METLPDETPIYKYMAIDSFLHFFLNRSLLFQKICKWPDHFEGKRYEVLKEMGLFETDSSLDEYFGSCWTLQQDDIRLFETKLEYHESCRELHCNGSPAMWEAYCKGGGLRIKTTIGKVLTVLQSCKNPNHGKVCYTPLLYVKEKPKTLEEALFYKLPGYRYEDEYRFIVRSQDQSGLLHFSVDDMRDFIDEMLVSPSTVDEAWKSRVIYKLVVSSEVSKRTDKDTNIKDDRLYCRISQLYSWISGQ